jgi:acyl-CoA synthetase (NDP forming)
MSLDGLFNPSSIVVVGASDQEGKVGNIILSNLRQSDAKIFAVNPYDDYVGGMVSYPTVTDLPEVPDLAIVAIPAKYTVEVVAECAEKGIPFVIPVASGFSEIGGLGVELQNQLCEVIKGKKTRILGPNTLGILIPRNRIDTFFTSPDKSPRPHDGTIAVISQSGSVLTGVFEMAENEGIGVSVCVGLGNKVDLDENDFLEYLARDTGTKCIALYLESFADGQRFVRLAGKITPVKPVVAIKAGRTERGRHAAQSHTGALASASDELVNGIFGQFGIIRAYDVTELLDTAKGMAWLDHIKGPNIAVVSSTGGFGIIAADYIESSVRGVDMEMAAFSEDTKKRIIDSSVYFASAENPIDLTGSVTDRMYDAVLATLQEDEGVDAILLLVQLQTPGTTEQVVEIAQKWSKMGKKPIVVCSIGGRYSWEVLKSFEARCIPAYNSLKRAILVLRALYDRGVYLKRIKSI